MDNIEYNNATTITTALQKQRSGEEKQVLKKNNTLILYIVLFCVMAFTINKQENPYKEKDIIPWSEETKLIWGFFKGKPPESNHEAITCSTIYCKYEESDKSTLKMNIRACFIKKESWKKEKNPSDYLLNHEQKHFDFTELYTRKLRKILMEAVFKNEAVAEKEIPKIIRSNNKALNDHQYIYDKETNHSKNKENQYLWDKKIDEELKSLSNYTNNIVEIKIN